MRQYRYFRINGIYAFRLIKETAPFIRMFRREFHRQVLNTIYPYSFRTSRQSSIISPRTQASSRRTLKILCVLIGLKPTVDMKTFVTMCKDPFSPQRLFFNRLKSYLKRAIDVNVSSYQHHQPKATFSLARNYLKYPLMIGLKIRLETYSHSRLLTQKQRF